jgi:hypothetical protein
MVGLGVLVSSIVEDSISAIDDLNKMEMFDITLSRILTADDLVDTFSRLIPDGLKIDVFPESDTPEEVGAIWAYMEETNDPDWPCSVMVIHYGDECELGDYPDLRIAEYLHKYFGCNVLLFDVHSFVSDLDPQDPYWALAYVNGQWYFADTCDTPRLSRLYGANGVKCSDRGILSPSQIWIST